MTTVLVADDEPGFREMMTHLLEDAGYAVLSAADGQEAWDLLESRGADLAVLDVNMPRLDGLELTRRIRGDARFCELPILMFTVRSLVEDHLAGLERGADEYVTKPFAKDMLMARLKVLERRILKKG